MVLEWDRDTETFKFKTIYKIETSLVMIEILCDDVANAIIDGKIVVRTEIFMKIVDSELLKASTIEAAQIYMLEKTLNNCDSIILPDTQSNLPIDELKHIFSDLYDTYLHQMATIRVVPEAIQNYQNSLKEMILLQEFEACSKEPLPFDQLTVLRKRLILEEFNEVKDALIERNVPHVAKEICDLKYVLYGTILSFNIEMEELIYYASWSFFKKEIEDSKDIVFSAIKALGRCLEAVDDALLPVLKPYQLTKSSINALAIIDYCCDLYHFPIHECFKEVHRSNMSKFGINNELIRNEHGKIMKGPNYSPADLNRFFDNYS